MRASEDRIKQAILYPIAEVRQQALRYFTRASNPDPTPMPLVIRAVEGYGREASYRLLRGASHVAQTEETVGWLMAELRRDYDCEDLEQDNYRFAVALALCFADPQLIAPHRQEILQIPAFPERLAPEFEQRLDMASWDWPRCRDALVQFGKQRSDRPALTLPEIRQGDQIVEALAWHGRGHEAEVLSFIQSGLSGEGPRVNEVLEPFIIRLAGKMRLQAALPLLIERLYEGSDVISDACVSALSEIGTDEVVKAITDALPTANEGFRNYAVEPLEHIHSDLAVQRCLEFFHHEDDLQVKGRLAHALLTQFADEAIEPVREYILSLADVIDPEVLDLTRELVVVSTVLDRYFPEYAEWKAEAERTNWGDLEPSRISEKYFSNKTVEEAVLEILQRHGVASLGELEDQLDGLEYDEYENDFEPLEPVQRKPGRNDPCPCGSGKKYKKCCMKKQGG